MTESFAQSASGLKLAVLGSPIAHSLSPALHAAAYARLGLDWSYGSADVEPDGLTAFIRSRDESWRGLSLTMPLKEQVLPLLAERDEVAQLTRSANTVLFDWSDGVPLLRGFNTDVPGLVRALAGHEITSASTVTILGAGATARSALVSAAELGAQAVRVLVREPARAEGMRLLAADVGLAATIGLLPGPAAEDHVEVPGLTISTLPGGVLPADAVDRFRTTDDSVVLDVAYHPWPSVIGEHWIGTGGRAISGLEMLVHQALLQVRVFTLMDPLRTLPDEANVLADMRAAVGLPAQPSS